MTGTQSSAGRISAGNQALTLIAVLFFLAGLTRLGLGVATVNAAEQDTPAVAPDSLTIDATDALLRAIQARETKVQADEAALAEQKAALATAQDELRRQMDALSNAEQQLLQTLSLTETAAEDDITKLVAVYENMKPQNAAQLFGQMDVAFAAGFFIRLRPDFAGAVMAEMDPIAAYAISAVLAGRHANTPRN